MMLTLWMGSGSTQVFAATLTQADQNTLAAAIEDYKFSEFTTAIGKFKSLHASYPDHATIVEYLGRSYEESGNQDEAIQLYRQWLKTGDEKAQTSRFAWLGLAHALIQLKRDDEACQSLSQWLAYYPDDADAAILYGSTLLRINRDRESAQVWDGILSKPQSTQEDQAAAHYYTAFLAYKRGDLDEQRKQAALSLQKDPNGAYSASAEQFMNAKPARELGINGSARVEFDYTSNVEMLPDVTKPTAGGSKADTLTQTTLSLLYNFNQFSLGYAGSVNVHNKRTDLDLGYHSLYAVWAYGSWFAIPRLEYLNLGNNHLMNGGGADAGWANNNLRLTYAFRYNRYSKNFNGSDLRRLGGITNSLNAEWLDSHGAWNYSANLALSNLLSKGDRLYGKSDSYWQTGIGGMIGWKHDEFSLQTTAGSYYRKYKTASLLTPKLVRRDSNITANMQLTWQALQRDAFTLQLTGNGGWQRNNSKDSTKGYKEWHAGSGIQLDW